LFQDIYNITKNDIIYRATEGIGTITMRTRRLDDVLNKKTVLDRLQLQLPYLEDSADMFLLKNSLNSTLTAASIVS